MTREWYLRAHIAWCEWRIRTRAGAQKRQIAEYTHLLQLAYPQITRDELKAFIHAQKVAGTSR